MVREIVHDPMFLQRKSEDATQTDLQTAQDLLDTLMANFDRCVGMAANMIGIAKRIIAEIKKMNNEQTELLKKALEAVIHLYEDDSKKRK